MNNEELVSRLDWAIDDLVELIKVVENNDPEIAARLDIIKNHLDNIVEAYK